MVVAAGAIDGHAEEGLTDVGGDLGEHFLAALFGIDVAGDEMLGAGAQVAGGDQRFLVAGEHLVAGDLLLDEAVVRLVRVEGVDHVVAVAPGVRTILVEFEAVGVGVANDVEPLGGPALAVVRRGEQAVDDLFVGVGRLVFQEGVYFVGRRRQAGEVVGDAADQTVAIESGGRGELLLGEAVEDEGVDGIADPGIVREGHRGADDFLEGPVFGSGSYEGFVGLG